MSALTARVWQIGMPSRILGGYLIRQYFIRFFGLLIGLTTILQLLDLMAQSDQILAADGATWQSLVRYLSMRVPQLASEFTPFSALLAAILTLAGLSQHSEIIVMKASSLSAHTILYPLLAACTGIALVHFAFNETVLVRANASLNYWQENDYATNLPPVPDVASDAMMLDGNNLVLIQGVRRNANLVVLDKVSIFERDGGGNLMNMVRADFAIYIDNNWTLYEVRRFNVIDHTLETFDNQTWPTTIPPERFLALTVRPDRVDIFVLWESIQELRREGHATGSLITSFYHKMVEPMATILMPLLAAIVGFGIHRGGTLFIRSAIAMALGFGYFVADNFMLAMGEFGVVPPLLAAWAPILLFTALGLSVLIYTEE